MICVNQVALQYQGDHLSVTALALKQRARSSKSEARNAKQTQKRQTVCSKMLQTEELTACSLFQILNFVI